VYVKNIVQNLIELDKSNSYFLCHYLRTSNPLYSSNEILYRRYKWLPLMFSDSLYLGRNPDRFDIVHRFLPGGFLFRTNARIVITVLDLFCYKRYPFNRKTRNVLVNPIIRSSLERAQAIIAISEFTRRDIIETFRVKASKVHVAYPASSIVPKDLAESQRLLQDQYGIRNCYILFVSTIEPRKNLISLVKAFEILKEKYYIEEDLVVVGKRGWEFQNTLECIGRSRCRDSIRLVGFVPEDHLPCFYGKASLFVYPSLMEGFGIPPVEAMTCGCPTLTSNTSSLPEVMGYEDMMFSPLEVDEIVEKSLRLLEDEASREDNVRKGLENAARFSWQASASKIVNIYNKLGG
jgi:glycosyltransferase involved in cell wall biosynthesis